MTVWDSNQREGTVLTSCTMSPTVESTSPSLYLDGSELYENTKRFTQLTKTTSSIATTWITSRSLQSIVGLSR